MTMPFTPCQPEPGGGHCADITVNILHAMFGDIIWVLVEGLDPNTASASLLSTLFGFFNSGLLVVGSLIVTYVAVMGAINTANDGEAMGRSWSSVWTPVRIVAGGAVLLPSASGFSFIQMLVMMISLWGVGFANGIYNLGMTTSLFQPTELVASTREAGTYYGTRDFARQYLAAAYCRKAANSIYKDDMGVPDVNWVLSVPDKINNAAGRRDKIYYAYDRNKVTNLGGGQPICGTFTLTSYSAPAVYVEDSGTQKALELMRAALNTNKLAAINTLMYDIDLWVATMPYDLNQSGFDAVQSKEFNRIVTKAETAVLAAITARLGASTDVDQGVAKFVTTLNKEGWSMGGGWYQRVGLLRSKLSSITSEAVATATEPSLSSLPADARAQLLKSSVTTVTEAITKKSEKDASYQSDTIKPEDLASMMPKDGDSDINVGSLANDLGIKLSLAINNAMKRTTDAVLGTNASDPNAKPMDAVSRMKQTGDILAGTRMYMWTAEVSLKTALTAARVIAGGVGSVQVFGNKFDASNVVTALWDWVLTVPVPILNKIAEYTEKLAFYFGVILPSLPYTIFMIAVVGWLLAVFQSVIAAPLWAIMHMRPSQTFVGSDTQGYLLLLALFVRPALAVLGLFAAMLIADPVVDYIAKAFFAMRGDVVVSTGLLGAVAQFYTFFWWLTVFGLVLLPVLYMIFGLPQVLPDHVLQWIGAGLSDLGATGATGQMQASVGMAAARVQGPTMNLPGTLSKLPPGGGGGGGGAGAGPGSGPGSGGRPPALPVNANQQGVVPSSASGAGPRGGGGGGGSGGRPTRPAAASRISPAGRAAPESSAPSAAGMGGNASAPPTAGAAEGTEPVPRALGERLSDGAGMALGRIALDAKSAYDTARANGGSFRQQFAAGLRDTMLAARQQGGAAFADGPQAGIEAAHAQRLAADAPAAGSSTTPAAGERAAPAPAASKPAATSSAPRPANKSGTAAPGGLTRPPR